LLTGGLRKAGMKELQTEAARRRAIAWAVAQTANTPLAPDTYESDLLEQYTQGTLTLDQVLLQVDQRMHHLIYRSRATYPFSATDLTALQEQSHAWNEAHDITGLLCYSNGHFVQVLEGSVKEVHALFEKIQRDKRHYRVQALSDRGSSQRWFADWRMALVQTESEDFHWLLGYLEAKGHNLVQPQIPITEPHLMTLLTAFSTM
jgi:hypothetical protein